MKFLKTSCIFLFSILLMFAFIPHASAKHHCNHRTRTSFGFNFNIGAPARMYVGYPAVVAAPVPVRPVYAPVPVRPMYYYSPYARPVVAYPGAVYVAPQMSYVYWP